jgi:hypothetical protein
MNLKKLISTEAAAMILKCPGNTERKKVHALIRELQEMGIVSQDGSPFELDKAGFPETPTGIAWQHDLISEVLKHRQEAAPNVK